MYYQTHPFRARFIALLAFLFVFYLLKYLTEIWHIDNFEQSVGVAFTIVILSRFYRRYTDDFLNSVGRGVYHLGLWRWLRRTIPITIITFILIIYLGGIWMTYSLDSSAIDREFLLQIDLSLFLLAILISFFVGMYSAASYSLDRPIVVSVAAPLLLFTTAVVGNLLSIALSDPLLFVSNILNPVNILAFDSEIQERVVISAAAAMLVVGIQTIIWPGWEKSPYEREQERLPVRIPIDPFINRELLLDVRNILIRYNNSVDPDGYNDRFSNDPPYDVSVIEPVEGMTQQEVLEITDNETRRLWSKRYRRAIRETNYEEYGKEAIYLEIKVVREAEEEQKEWRAQIFLKLKKWANRVREKIRTKWGEFH